MRARQGLGAFLAGCMIVAALPAWGNTGTVYGAENGALTNGELTSNADGWTIGGSLGADIMSFEDGHMSLWTEAAGDFSLTQTISNVAKGDYTAKVAVVGNGSKGASESNDSLTLTVKDDTTGESQSKKLVTDGWDNWDNTPETAALSVNEGDAVTVIISGELIANDWYGLKNVVFAPYTEAVDAPITVQKVNNLSEDFIHGVDVSSYLSLVQSGVKYYDSANKEADLFDIMEDAGINYVRLRVWNSPFALDSDGNKIYVEEDGATTHKASEIAETETDAYGGKQYFLANGTQVYLETYGAGVCDVETAAIIGKIATDHHMKVLVDFHYSDFWADPKKMTVPKKWKNMTLEQKAEALEAFTRESLTTLREAGVDVGMVQIGNEINNGMAGQSDAQDVYTLLKAGSKAVRSVSKDILIAVHFTDPQSEGYQSKRAAELKEAGVDYDAFGTSFYPFWHGSADGLYEDLKEIASTYGKKVYVAEISYAWTLKDGDGYGNVVYDGAGDQEYNYSIGVEGQAAAVRDAIAAVSRIGANGLGTFYWEPAWIPVNYAYKEDGSRDEEIYAANKKQWTLHGSGWATKYANDYDPEVKDDDNGGTWDNQAFFDFEGHVLDSINVYKWVYTGAVGPTKVSTVDKAVYEMKRQTTPKLPETVTVNLNDGSTKDVKVTWDAAQVAELVNKDFGEYTVDGTVGEFSFLNKGETVTVAAGDWKTTCTVTVTGDNYVTNGSFETGDASDWTLTNYLGENVGWPSVDKSSSNAKSGLYYYKAWNEGNLDFAIDQTIKPVPKAGKYLLFAYYQGTGVKELSDKSKLYAKVTYKNGTTKTYETAVEIHNVWKDFYQAKASGIVINDNVTSITVGTRLACSAEDLGAWLVVDDISLMYMEALTADESAIGAATDTKKDDSSTQNTTRSYTLKYNVNGGSKLSTASKKVTYGKTYGKLASPVRKGYTFVGWFTKKSGGTQIKASSKVTITKDTTVYAHWKKVGAPAQVKKVKAKNSAKKTAKITFKKVSGANGYEIRYSTSSKMKSAKKVTTKTTSKTIAKLKKGKTYYVQVRAYKLDSAGKKVYSKKYSTKVKIKIKK